MIVTPGVLAPPAGRLLARLAAEGRRMVTTAEVPAGAEPVTLAVSDGEFVFDFAGMVRAIAPRPFRVLLLSRLGAHPDARTATLQRLWRLEEHVRGGGAPTLTLRFAPLVGRESPLIRRLASRPGLPRGGRGLLNPVTEDDALETLRRALDDASPWSGWFEVAGPEVWSLAELRDLAVAHARGSGAGAWEPPLDEMAEHRLAESEPWAERFAVRPAAIRAALAERVA